MTLAILGWIHIPIWLAYLGYAALAAGTVVAVGTAAPGCATTNGSTTPPDGPMCGGNDMECNPEDAGQRGDLADSFTPADQLPQTPDLALPHLRGVNRRYATVARTAHIADFYVDVNDRRLIGVMDTRPNAGDGGRVFAFGPMKPTMAGVLAEQMRIDQPAQFASDKMVTLFGNELPRPTQITPIGHKWWSIAVSTGVGGPIGLQIGGLALVDQAGGANFMPIVNKVDRLDNSTNVRGITSSAQCGLDICFGALNGNTDDDQVFSVPADNRGQVLNQMKMSTVTGAKGQSVTLEPLQNNPWYAVLNHGDAANGDASLAVMGAQTGVIESSAKLGLQNAVLLPHVPVSPQRKYAAIAGSAGELRIVDLGDPRNIKVSANAAAIGAKPNGIAVSDDGYAYVAVGGAIRVFDFTGMNFDKPVEIPNREIKGVAYELGFCWMARATLRSGTPSDVILCTADVDNDKVKNDIVAVSPLCSIDDDQVARYECPSAPR